MDEKVKIVLVFLVGGAIGAFISHKVTIKKAEKEIEEYFMEINDQQRVLFQEEISASERRIPIEREVIGDVVQMPKRPMGVYTKSNKNQVNYSKTPETETTIQTITQEEFIKDPLFDKISFSYYNDGVLVDANSAILDIDMDAILGNIHIDDFKDGLEHPGILYIRNRRLKADYEITREYENYFPEKDMVGSEPKLKEKKGEIVEFDDDGKPKKKRRS
jgi:hypothetical protein